MLDKEFTKELQRYLSTEEDKRNIEAGALLLLRMNRNYYLYENILRNRKAMAKRLFYELEKHLRIRLDGYTKEQVKELSETLPKKIAPLIKENKPKAGKRKDHESLPEEIKEIYERGGEIYQKIKQTYNTLLSMENAQPCDRYEYLKILCDLDKKYREGWKTYDNYQRQWN